ncbi:MAG: hypothetical protein HOQ32_00560 [Lysobacter sp.]|nr:hypothetical protein [Lysobacter sp.]
MAGIAPAAIVHEDATALAFADLRQTGTGHAPVLPRAHLLSIHALSLSAA